MVVEKGKKPEKVFPRVHEKNYLKVKKQKINKSECAQNERV